MHDGVASVLSKMLTLCSTADVVCMLWLLGRPRSVFRLLQVWTGSGAACECAYEMCMLGRGILGLFAAGSGLLQVRAGCVATAIWPASALCLLGLAGAVIELRQARAKCAAGCHSW